MTLSLLVLIFKKYKMLVTHKTNGEMPFEITRKKKQLNGFFFFCPELSVLTHAFMWSTSPNNITIKLKDHML